MNFHGLSFSHGLLSAARKDVCWRLFATSLRSCCQSSGKVNVLFPSKDEVQISLRWNGRDLELRQRQDHTIGKTLGHMKKWAFGLESQRKGLRWLSRQRVSLRSLSGTAVEGVVRNYTAWEKAAVLKIGEDTFSVQVQQVADHKVRIPSVVAEGIAIFPQILLKGIEEQMVKYRWYRKGETEEDILVGTDRTYVPVAADVDRTLRLVVSAPIDGELVTVERLATVLSLPAQPAFESRNAQDLTLHDCGSAAFRVVSYNVLSDGCQDQATEATTTSKASETSSAEKGANDLSPVERSQQYLLLARELQSYKSDVMCLQEVDPSAFRVLSPHLATVSYDCRLALKSKQQKGCAIFYRRDRFALASHDVVRLSSILANENHLGHVFEPIKNRPALLQRLMSHPAVVQLALLEMRQTKELLLVANTQLVSEADAHHLRMFQVRLLTLIIKEKLRGLDAVPFILCGDLASSPESSILDYLKGFSVSTDNKEWASGGPNEWAPIRMTNTLRMTPVTDGREDVIPYTKLVQSEASISDYIIFSDDCLRPCGILPMPALDALTEHGSLPSPIYPSNHFAVVADFEMTPNRYE